MTTQYKYLLILFVFLFILNIPASVCAFGSVKFSLNVVDEENRPVEGAQIEACLSGGCLTKNAIHGVTDSNGIFSTSGSSSDGVVGGGVTKEGYYLSAFHHDFIKKNIGMWQPWNKEITVVLRPIINPVPMYVRNNFFEIPAHDKEIGFDLMKADWVIPYGQGTQSDFIFKMVRRYNNIDDYDSTLTMTFSKSYDGIQLYKEDPGGDFNSGSWYRLLRTAPVDGYAPKLSKRSAVGPSAGPLGRVRDSSTDSNYFFRIRSEVDRDGKLKQAMYGKIKGEIKFRALAGENKRGGIEMHYYLNPDYTRNLEFDPKRNLFLSLPKMEGVAQP